MKKQTIIVESCQDCSDCTINSNDEWICTLLLEKISDKDVSKKVLGNCPLPDK